MDGSRFDAFTRTLAASGSRRRLIGGLVAGIVGLAGIDRVDARTCTRVGSVCREGASCCTGVCGPKDRTGRRRCACPTGTTLCNEKCVNAATAFQSDPDNCGACGNVCPESNPTCYHGACRCVGFGGVLDPTTGEQLCFVDGRTGEDGTIECPSYTVCRPCNGGTCVESTTGTNCCGGVAICCDPTVDDCETPIRDEQGYCLQTCCDLP